MRPIDADALIEDIREHSSSYFADDFAHEWVDQQPTIELQRKKGKWTGYHGEDSDWQRSDGSPVFLVCSECGAIVVNNFAAEWNYCCRCGADMRGEEHETD